MENAVEALKMAFAVIVFGIALTISIVMFSEAKNTSDVVLAMQDETNYYDYYAYDYGENVSKYEKRIVGLETVIPTLYKYYKENYTVIFKKGNYDESNGSLYNVENLVLYTSRAPTNFWGSYKWQNYWTKSIDCTKICSFDMDEEIKRHEPWSGKQSDMKNNLDCFIKGGTFRSPDGNTSRNTTYSVPFKKLIGQNGGNENNPQFVEELGEYVYENNEGDVTTSGTTITIDGEVISVLRKNKKRVITYTLIKGI